MMPKDKVTLQRLEERVRKQQGQINLMLQVMVEFCQRVERGEVRSVRTYSKFRDIIREVTGDD